MRSIVLLSILVLSGTASAQIQNPGNGHWYDWAPPLEFLDARTLATVTGGTLVAIQDAAEQQWIIDELASPASTGSFWIGLTDEITEGVFLWDSGEPLTYTNWQPGQPGAGDTVLLTPSAGGQWVVYSSGEWKPGVIEYLTQPTIAVSNVTSIPGLLTVELAWENPIAYDTIEVYRDGAGIASLPGSATSIFDADPIGNPRRYWIIGTVTGVPAAPAFHMAMAIDPAYELSIPPVQAIDGSLATAHVMLDSAQTLQGWSYNVCHDGGLAQLVSVQMGAATATSQGGAQPMFYLATLHPGGFTVGVVVGWDSAILPPGQDYELDRANYQPLVEPPAQIALGFCGPLGSPPLPTTVVHQGGEHIPVTIDGVIDLLPASFIRADCNGDLAPDIADVIFTGDHLFGNGAAPPCGTACDSNSDGILDVADMVFTALALFAGGPLPAPPFPACGPSPVIDCASPPACP